MLEEGLMKMKDQVKRLVELDGFLENSLRQRNERLEEMDRLIGKLVFMREQNECPEELDGLLEKCICELDELLREQNELLEKECANGYLIEECYTALHDTEYRCRLRN